MHRFSPVRAHLQQDLAFSLAQAATPTDFPYRSMVPPILSDITEFLGTYFWLYLFSAVSEAFLTPAASGPMKHLSILGTKIG